LSHWRVSGTVLPGRVIVIGAMAGALALTTSLAPIWPLLVVAVALLVLALLEGRGPPRPD
jgi:hypothetical protein